MEGILIQGWDLILPVSDATSTSARGATLAAARWRHEPQPISNQPVGVRVSTPCGAVSIRGISVFPPGCWSCRDMEGFMIQRRERTLPPSRGCAGYIYIYEHQPIRDRLVGLGFPHRAGRCRPGGTPFSSPGYRSCICVEGFQNGTLSFPGGAGFLLELQSINDQPVVLGFPHRAELCRPGGSPVSSPSCQS